MSETMAYILLALRQERHGYGVMQYVGELTKGRVTLGAGTIYSTLGKLTHAGLIRPTTEIDRRKNYLITDRGLSALKAESRRIAELHEHTKDFR
jgi:DNA-binding PadR family transcriptional regulator